MKCDCESRHGTECVEVKCPHTHRTGTISDAAQDKSFHLYYVNGKLALKKEHQYYYECKTNMFVTKKCTF